MIALSTTSEKKTFIEHGCNVFCWPSKKNKCLSYKEKKSLTCCTTCVANNGKILWLRRLLEEKKREFITLHRVPCRKVIGLSKTHHWRIGTSIFCPLESIRPEQREPEGDLQGVGH